MRLLLAAMVLGILSPVFAAAPAQAYGCTSNSDEAVDNYTISGGLKPAHRGGSTTYRWGLVIEWNHCTYSGGYYDDKKTLKVYGRITQGPTYCEDLGDIGGYTKYLANVGIWGAFNPGEVEWACTSSKTWSFTWTFNPQPRLYNGAGDRCVGSSWKMPRWGPYVDSEGNIPAVCF